MSQATKKILMRRVMAQERRSFSVMRSYDRMGHPISMMQAMRRSHSAYARVGLTHLSGSLYVSTVWLTFDHGFPYLHIGRHTPLIFESMVFTESPANPEALHQGVWQERYATLADARAGHSRIVRALLKSRTTNYVDYLTRLEEME